MHGCVNFVDMPPNLTGLKKFLQVMPRRLLKKLPLAGKKRNFTGVRSAEKALEAFKLALYNAQMIDSKPSDYTKICMRIAWLYRILKDEREDKFLKYALKFYYEVYEKKIFLQARWTSLHVCI